MAYQRVYPNKRNWENEPSQNTPLNASNLNAMDNAIYALDGQNIIWDTSKANQSDLLQSLKTVAYNTTTGVFTFTFWNGSTVTVDLNIEKIPVSFSMSEQGIITMTTADGTQYTANVGSLIKLYTFDDSDTIDFTTITDSSGNKTITAIVKDGSIHENHLDPDYLAELRVSLAEAEDYAQQAEDSKDEVIELHDDCEDIAEQVAKDKAEIIEKVGVTNFEVNYRTGNLEYTLDATYDFTINTTTGNLEWEVA